MISWLLSNRSRASSIAAHRVTSATPLTALPRPGLTFELGGDAACRTNQTSEAPSTARAACSARVAPLRARSHAVPVPHLRLAVFAWRPKPARASACSRSLRWPPPWTGTRFPGGAHSARSAVAQEKSPTMTTYWAILTLDPIEIRGHARGHVVCSASCHAGGDPDRRRRR